MEWPGRQVQPGRKAEIIQETIREHRVGSRVLSTECTLMLRWAFTQLNNNASRSLTRWCPLLRAWALTCEELSQTILKTTRQAVTWGSAEAAAGRARGAAWPGCLRGPHGPSGGDGAARGAAGRGPGCPLPPHRPAQQSRVGHARGPWAPPARQLHPACPPAAPGQQHSQVQAPGTGYRA